MLVSQSKSSEVIDHLKFLFSVVQELHNLLFKGVITVDSELLASLRHFNWLSHSLLMIGLILVTQEHGHL